MKIENIFTITPKFIVKFENKDAVIYIDGKRFIHCKYLLLLNPHENRKLEPIDDVDKLKTFLGSQLERNLTPKELGIKPEELFWGHCSNLQAWYENNCDSRILHSNLSFPLLKRLTIAGDIKAKKVFKDEIAKRLLGDYIPIKRFLIEEDYLSYLNADELDIVLKSYKDLIKNSQNIEDIEKETEIFIFLSLKYLDHNNTEKLEEIYKNLIASDNKIGQSKIWYNFHFISNRFNDTHLSEYCLKRSYEINYKTYKKLKDSKDYNKVLEDFYALGLNCRYCHQYKLALKCFLSIVNHTQHYKNIWGHLGIIYEKLGNEFKAKESFKRALRIDPKNSELPVILAHNYLELNKIDALIKICKKGLKINPKNVELWSLLAKAYKAYPDGLYEDKGDINKAISCCLEALKIEAKNIFTIQHLIQLYYNNSDYKKSQEYCIHALKLNPNNSQALDILSETYIINGENEKAIRICKETIDREPRFFSNWFRLGKIYYSFKNYQKAVEFLREALRLDRSDIDAWHFLENSYFGLGDKINAWNARVNKFYYDQLLKKKFNRIVSND